MTEQKLYQFCDTMAASEYRSLIRPFLDISTLSARLKTEECISTEYRMCDGSWHRMLFTVKKRDESGNVTHVLCTVRSISDSKRREENLNFAAEAAKREAEMKTRFLATMSHDIRTPLNGIIGMVNMGNQYADDPQMQQKIRENAMESLKYLVSLVNDVLDMNKLQSGDLKDHQLLFDLTTVLRELNQIYDERAAKKGIQYEIDWKNGTYSHIALVVNVYNSNTGYFQSTFVFTGTTGPEIANPRRGPHISPRHRHPPLLVRPESLGVCSRRSLKVR